MRASFWALITLTLATVLTLTGLAAEPRQPAPVATAAQAASAKIVAGGIAVAELDASGVHYASFGAVAPRDGVAVEKVIFEIGSVTKVFTSLLLAQTVVEGQAALTDPIAKFLPPDLPLDARVAAITLEQLATHTSGLPRLPDNFTTATADDPYVNYGEAELLAFLRQHHPRANAPQPPAYSNLGAGLLGYVLTRIHGKSYAELLREKITAPLALRDTTLVLDAEQQTRLATPFAQNLAATHWNFAVLAPAGGIRSTLADMTAFARALLDAGSPIHSAWELARQPRVADSTSVRFGLAIMMRKRGSETVYFHGGATGGFTTHFEFTPQSGRAAIIWTNNSGAAFPSEIAQQALDPTPVRAEVAIAPEKLAAYTGIYSIDGRSRFTVVENQGRLEIRLTGQTFNPVVFAGEDVFTAKSVGAEFRFLRSPDGSIGSVELHQHGHITAARRTGAAPTKLVFLTPEKARDYAGTFALAPGQNFEITARGRWVVAKLDAQPAFPVFCEGGDRFVYDVVEATMIFERDAQGTVSALVLHQNGAEMRAPKITAPAK